jgi:CIC family chloride channel protein
LIVTLLVTKFAPEARGHGVPEVMDAVYYSEGRIRPMVAAIKSLASSLSIGSGAAVGREGPIIQIGASLGSTIGQIISLAAWQRITLVAAGAGSGIAATFNTPIGGVMFAVELMMPEVSVRTFLPVALATGTATFIARLFVGLEPAFQTPPLMASDHHATSFYALLLYAFVGLLAGLAATVFIQGLHRTEVLFDRIRNPYLRHVVGMLIVDVMIYALFQTFGHYYVEGVGYATIQAVLVGGLQAAPLHGLEGTYTGVSLADVASRNFAIVDPEEIMFGVIGRMWKNGDTMAVVSRGNGVVGADQVLGVITKEHVADSVAASVRPYT